MSGMAFGWMLFIAGVGKENFGLEDRGCAKLPSHALDLFEKIIAKNEGKLSGFFDVFAWKVRGDDYLFIEYKWKGDHANKNELKWIEAAISVGVKPEQLVIVTY